MIQVSSSADLSDLLHQARQASWKLARSTCVERNLALERMAAALHDEQDTILEANTLDLEASLDMAVPALVLEWLRLTPERLQNTVRLLRRLAALGDLGFPQETGVRVPIGVIALIYEAFPELTAIAAGLCLRTGNGLVLKGGNEASQTNQAIVQVIQAAIAASDLPQDSLLYLTSDQGDSVRTVLMQSPEIDLLIPYGRPTLVQQITRQATIPTLPTVMGNCYLYWGLAGHPDTVLKAIIDSRQGEPDPVNAVEKVLIHSSHQGSILERLWQSLREKGYEVRGDETLAANYPQLVTTAATEWSTPYLTKVVAFQQVESIDEAIAQINHHSNGHADCIVTDSYTESQHFIRHVNSLSLYINTSPRFARSPAAASGIALGMTNNRTTGTGRISLATLTTLKQVIP